MRNAIRLVTVAFLTSFWVQNAEAQQTAPATGYHPWWRDRPFGQPFRDPAAKELPLVSVKGNKFVDPNGKTVLFRGLSMPKGAAAKEGDYGKAIITYLEGRGIGWLGWVFDPEWGPHLLQSWDTYELTGGGEFFRLALHGKIGG